LDFIDPALVGHERAIGPVDFAASLDGDERG
jgi:hypothetical protein